MIVQVPGLLGLPAGIVPPVNETVRGSDVEAVPPQVVAAVPGTTVNTVPGRVSETLMPVKADPVGFRSVTVRVVVPPAGNEDGEKLFSIFTDCTVSVSEVGELFVSPCCVTRALGGMLFSYEPVLVEVTFTWITQFRLEATVALFNVIDVPPGFAINVAEGPQFSSAFTGVAGSAIKTPDGNWSVRDAPVRGAAGLVLLILIVSTLVSPTNTVFGENDLLIEGEAMPIMVRVALDGLVFVIETTPPEFNCPVERNSLAGIVLIRLPTVVDVTSMETVQSPGVPSTCGGTVPPLNDSMVVPGTAVTLPPQELEIFAWFAIDNPGCTPTRLSVQEVLFN